MSRSDDPAPAPAGPRAIEEEHHQLRALLHVLTAADVTDAVPLLGRLRDQLVEHFQTEEGPDGFESVARRQPQYLPRLDEIFEEHRAFLERVERLLESARACARHRKELLRAIATLAHDLHEHEARENTLLGDIMYTDLGGHH